VVKIEKFMGVSQLFGGHVPGLPQVYAYGSQSYATALYQRGCPEIYAKS